MRTPQSLISTMMQKARTAQAAVSDWDQEQIDRLCLAVGWQVYEDANIQRLAQTAVAETGMGTTAHKVAKHKAKILGVLSDVMAPEAKTVGLIGVDEKRGIRKYAKPVGVIGALTPVTNPTATPGSNAISILKGRNAVIFAPHPRAEKSSKMAVDMMRAGLRTAGAPEDLIQIIEEPSIELANLLMSSADLVVATGGVAMVKAAYSSGTPSFGVGPGNAVQIIAEDAEIEDAAAKVTASKSFDNATSCSSENGVIVHDAVYEEFVSALVKRGTYLCSAAEKEQLQSYLWKQNAKGYFTLNPEIVAKSAIDISAGAGISVPADTLILAVEAAPPVNNEPFADEKLSPVLAIWRYGEFEEGLKLLTGITDHAGTGHSCGIHTFNEDYIHRLGLAMKSSRILVRQPQAAGNGGNFFNGLMSTATLGCGSWGGNSTTENIHYRHFINITWLSLPLDRHKPTDEEMFGSYWERWGKEAARL